MKITGPTVKRFALQVDTHTLKSLFIQVDLGVYDDLENALEAAHFLGEGVIYLDLLDSDGDEIDSKPGSTPNFQSEVPVLIIESRGGKLDVSVEDCEQLEVELNDAGLVQSANLNGQKFPISFIPQEGSNFSVRVLKDGKLINAAFIEETYQDFIQHITNPSANYSFEAILNSSYYEEDHALGNQIHQALLHFPNCDFSPHALEYFENHEINALSLNDSLSDNLAIGLFKHSLTLLNAGEGPFSDWSAEEKEQAQTGEIVRNQLLGNPSFYRNREKVFDGTDVIEWFLKENYSTKVASAMLRNRGLEISYLKLISEREALNNPLLNLHPIWAESKIAELDHLIAEDFTVVMSGNNGIREIHKVSKNSQHSEYIRTWQVGRFSLNMSKNDLSLLYGDVSSKNPSAYQHLGSDDNFVVVELSGGKWSTDLNEEELTKITLNSVPSYEFQVVDFTFDAIPKLTPVSVRLCPPTAEIKMYGADVEEFYFDLIAEFNEVKGEIRLTELAESSFFRCIDEKNGVPMFLAEFFSGLMNRAQDFFFEEHSLGGENILEGMDFEFTVEGHQGFNVSVASLIDALSK